MSWRSLAFGLRENQAYLAVFVLCKCFANQRLFGQQAHTNTHTEPVNLNYIHYHVHNTILLTMKQGISPGH